MKSTLREFVELWIAAYTLFAQINSMLLNQIINQQLRDEQVGYRSGRSTTEQIFVLRTMNIIEQVIESVHDSTCVL